MNKVCHVLIVAVSIIALFSMPLFAEVTYDFVDDARMKITSQQEVIISRQTALQRIENHTKALTEWKALLSEMDKLGITKSETD